MASEKDPRTVAGGPGRLPSNTVGANALTFNGPGGALAWTKARLENIKEEIETLLARVEDLEEEAADLKDRLDFLDPAKEGIRRIRTVATVADLKDVTDPQDGEFIHCKELGTFRYDASSLVVQDSQTVVRPNGIPSANPGRWIIDHFGQRGAANGLPTLDENQVVMQPVMKFDHLDTLDELRGISTEIPIFVQDRFKHVAETETVYRFDMTVTAPDNGLSVIKPVGVDPSDPGRWVPIEYQQRAKPHGLATLDAGGRVGEPIQYVQEFSSLSDLKAATPQDKELAFVPSYGLFRYSSSSSDTANDRSVVKPDAVDPSDPGRWVTVDYPQRDVAYGLATVDENGWLEQFPKGFRFVSTVASGADSIRALDPSTDTQVIFASGWTASSDHYGIYYYDPYLIEADNGRSVIKPNSVDPGDPGRWVSLDYAQRNKAYGVAGLDGNGRLRVARGVIIRDNVDYSTHPTVDDIVIFKNISTNRTCTVQTDGSVVGDVIKIALQSADATKTVDVKIFDGPLLETLSRDPGGVYYVEILFTGTTWEVIARSVMP